MAALARVAVSPLGLEIPAAEAAEINVSQRDS